MFGSPERLIIGQAHHLKDFDSVVCSFVKPGVKNDFLDRLRREGIDYEPIEDNHLFDPMIPDRIEKIAHKYRVDLLVTHEYKSNLYGHYAARKMGLPQIAYFHGWTAEDRKVRFYNWLDRKVLPRLDRIITVSCATCCRLADAGVPRDIISVVYNAIDVPAESAPERRPYGDTVVIGLLGRFSHEKGVHLLLEAVALIKNKAPNFRIELYGSGPEENNLRQMTSRLKLDDIVQFMGFRPDPENIYPGLDILVLPSLSEGHPVVILEAWKAGVPVVSTRAGGVPEVMQDGVDGLLVDVGDVSGLADALVRAIENPEMMKGFGLHGFELVKSKYSYQAQAKELARIYGKVVRGESFIGENGCDE